MQQFTLFVMDHRIKKMESSLKVSSNTWNDRLRKLLAKKKQEAKQAKMDRFGRQCLFNDSELVVSAQHFKYVSSNKKRSNISKINTTGRNAAIGRVSFVSLLSVFHC